MAYFSELIKNQVWEKALVVTGYNPNIWRKDLVGAWIKYDQYGEQSKYGWEIDHLCPVSRGGSDDISNLNALHWKNNRRKSDDYPDFYSEITSNGNVNVERPQPWTVKR